MKQRRSRVTLWTGVLALALGTALIGCGGGGGGGTGNNGGGNNGGGDNGGGNGGTNGSTPGVLPANVIFYSDIDSATGNVQVRYMKPDKTGDTLYATLTSGGDTGPTYWAMVPDAVKSNVFYFAYQATPTDAIGIYKNSTVSITGATELVPPTYSYVTNLLISPDDSTLAFIGAVGDNARQLYKVGTTNASMAAPTVLDTADQAAVSTTGDMVVYSKSTGGPADLWIRPLVAAGTARQLTNTATLDDTYPAFTRDGTRVVFSSGASLSESNLYSVRASDGGDLKQITNTSDLIESGASYNSDGTQIAFYGLGSTDSTKTGLYRINADGTGVVFLKASPTLGSDVYWTNTNGRGPSVAIGFRLNLPKRKPNAPMAAAAAQSTSSTALQTPSK